MKTCYFDPDVWSIADLVKPGELTRYWTITRINVPVAARGHKHGSDLLEKIVRDADGENVILSLQPSPSDGLDYDQLVAWYKRYGFYLTPSGYMERLPKPYGDDS